MESPPLPSSQWTSFKDWNWGGMKTRLETFFANINKRAIVEHVKTLTGKSFQISDPFSAGQYWCCLGLVAEDGSFFIARMRLPPHPAATGCLDDKLRTKCEVATMRYVRLKTSIPVPDVFANEMEGSEWARLAGAPYMIIEGFRGTTLQDAVDLFEIPKVARRKILDQWSLFQAELATLTFRQIGAIGAELDADSEPVVDKIATDEAGSIGPFSDAVGYLYSIANAKFQRALNGQTLKEKAATRFDVLGLYIFCDVISRANVFKSLLPGPFPLNHMDMGAQNLLIDNDFNIIAVIDWEMAQTAPWEAMYFPMPFPTNVQSDIDLQKRLNDKSHVAHNFTTKIFEAQRAYIEGFQRAEAQLKEQNTPVDQSLASILESDASKLFWIMERFGQDSADWDEIFMFATARIAFGMDEAAAEKYFQDKEKEVAAMKASIERENARG